MTNIGRETETVEFKEGIGQLDKGVKALSAMLNRHHHGTVFFGVNDSGDVIGMDVGDSTLEKFRNAIRVDIVPQVIPRIDVMETDDCKRYVSVSVTGHDVPYSWKGRYYIRNVTSNESAGPDIVSQIVLSRGMDPLKDMASDLQDLTFEHLFISLVSHGYHPRNDQDYFKDIGLLDDRGRFNLNAYLLSDQNSFPMQVIQFRGTDRSVMSDRVDFGNCCLIKSMDLISDHIYSMMETRVNTDSIERQETSLFDIGAFREAWVNACVHNAWRTYTPPSVLIFDDRVEIISYGRIPFPVSMEDFFTGDSRPVNSGLFSIFAKLNKIEQSGHGVPRIVSSYGREAFHITDSGLKVTIPFRFTPRCVFARRSNYQIRGTLNVEERMIIEYMEVDDEAKISDIADSIGISLSKTKKLIVSLKSRNMIENKGTNRRSKWVVL